MTHLPYFLVSEQVKRNACAAIMAIEPNADSPMMVQIKEKTRSLEQSAKLHAMFGELAIKAKWQRELLTLEQWKMLMISAHTVATQGDAKLTVGLEGELVSLRESSAKMSIKRMVSLIEYVQAWAAMNDIEFTKEGVSNANR